MINRIRRILLTSVVINAGNGQSTSVGLGGEPALTTTQLYGATSFQGGLRPVELDPGLNMDATEPAVERDSPVGNYGETMIVACGHAMHEGLATYTGIPIPAQGCHQHHFAAGRGGASLLQVSKGGDYYANWLMMTQKTPKPSCYLVTNMTIGETDQSRGEDGADWQERFTDWHEDYVADAMAVTGQTWTPFTVCNQMASHWKYASDDVGYPDAHDTPEIALAMWRAALEHPDIFCIFPRSILDYVDGVHHDNYSYQMMGKLHGRAVAKITAARMAGEPDPIVALQMLSVHVADATATTRTKISIKFSVPHPPLQFRTDWVAATDNYGFDIWNADGSLSDVIDTVAITAPDTVEITLDNGANFSAGKYLSIGFGRSGMTTSGRATGPRANLCDSEGDLDFYTDAGGTFRRLDNYPLISKTTRPPTSLAGGEVWDVAGEAKTYGSKGQALQRASGLFYVPNGFGINSTPSAVGANTLYAVRFDTPMRATGIAIEVTTLAAGNVRLGLYSIGRDGRPGALIEDLGEVSTGTTGTKIANFAKPRIFDGTAYMLVALFSATPTIVRGSTTSAGVAPKNGAASLLTATCISYWSASVTYGALPKVLPTLTDQASSSPPMIAMVGG